MTQDIGLYEGLQVELTENELAKLMVTLDHVLQEDHNSRAQLQIEGFVEAYFGNWLIDDVEELWAQKTRSVVARWDLNIAKKLIVCRLIFVQRPFGYCGLLSMDRGVGKHPHRFLRLRSVRTENDRYA